MNQILMKNSPLIIAMAALMACSTNAQKEDLSVSAANSNIVEVKVDQGFWGPKLETWRSVTINDVFDKFEGDYQLEWRLGDEYDRTQQRRDAFKNFDMVAEGKRGTGEHHGPPWYDGLVYETIRAAGDFLYHSPDPDLESRVDAYIDRIAAAQASDTTGFINTYTQLVEPDRKWGRNGGFLRWQHDVYNAGMLIEAGVHYYKGTGKTKLLEVAVKMTNHMYETMGPKPKLNIIPAHAGPEEALLDMYLLFKNHPGLKEKIGALVDEKEYYDLLEFWIEGRGQHVGLPKWDEWGGPRSDSWIRENKYEDPEKYGKHSRPSFGDYAQDSISVFDQKTIEGHAVRATLLSTGIAAMAVENNEDNYITTANNLWDNMVGKRMSVNGGVGTIAFDEKFGPDYYLPNDAYLETCAAVGAGFFSEKMSELERDGKYMDELERVLYNNILSGISLKGTRYTYENPLVSDHHHRWDWHDCPCCPPMFLKMVSALPDFIYSVEKDRIFVNLFVQSSSDIQLNDGEKVSLNHRTGYPWDGDISISVNTDKKDKFSILVRIPGWAQGIENPYGLYHSAFEGEYELSVNGETINAVPEKGYIALDRKWNKGDEISLKLPLEPRWVLPNSNIKELRGMAALASGPVIFGFEESDNKDLDDLEISLDKPLNISFEREELGGVNVITGEGLSKGESGVYKAVPYYAMGNSNPGEAYKIWMPIDEANSME
ncbi:glycoside hydrolase family 127 protein [Echinicola marina]|uniref:glycoside hydrolase family 127 protein n=1 Tax=Echinicola marina TaxID=2859768 RepID=UPI001CF63882|nr:beta-L-arabinofuranosidase domain-containing protein [Echinicola marina]UCS93370.1 glycoside hydrolase family 127 protein [Echinicola marina]